MRMCGICKEPLLESEIWKHLVWHHKEALMKYAERIEVYCGKCGKEFLASAEPIVKNNELFWIAPTQCKNCAGKYYGFIVDYVQPKIKKEG